MGFLSGPPVPTVGDLQLFQNKMTNAQTNALGWGWGRGMGMLKCQWCWNYRIMKIFDMKFLMKLSTTCYSSSSPDSHHDICFD